MLVVVTRDDKHCTSLALGVVSKCTFRAYASDLVGKRGAGTGKDGGGFGKLNVGEKKGPQTVCVSWAGLNTALNLTKRKCTLAVGRLSNSLPHNQRPLKRVVEVKNAREVGVV